MPRRSNRFQRLIALINECIGKGARVTESAMVRDEITGEEREVDVLIEGDTAGYKLNIAIEVAGRARSADVTWVESMHAKHASLPTNKLVLVAEKGFTSQALRKAQFHRIEAITIETALETDWELVRRLTENGIFELVTFSYSCSVLYIPPEGDQKEIDVPATSHFSLNGKDLTLDALVKFVLAQKETKDALWPRIAEMHERHFWIQYVPGLRCIGHLNGEAVHVTEVRIGLEVAYSATPVQYASGVYRGTPFIEGTSSGGASEVQFVLTRMLDGTCEGRLATANEIRILTNFSERE